MTCDCVEEEITVIRQLTKTLRTTNRSLRLQLQIEKEHADELFQALCASETNIMGELWEFGEMQCSPEDDDAIIETCLEALFEYNERRKPTVSPEVSGLLTRGA